MRISEISDKNIWELFLEKCSEKTFLDSWNWGEFQKDLGEKVWRFGIYKEEDLVSVVLVSKISARRGIFLFVPHGPVTFLESEKEKKEILEILINKLKELAKQEKAVFIRMAPVWERSDFNKKIFDSFDLRDAPIHIHPDLTWELDLEKDEENLLREMRKTTRYLIKKAYQDKDIEIIKSVNIEDVKSFDEVYKETIQRHNFHGFSLDYLIKEFKHFNSDNQIIILLGKYKGQVACAAMIIFWGGIGFYHQGASNSKFNKYSIPYLMQWEAIKEAKKRGCVKYNFWGIAPTDNPKHPWAGLSLFKKGFGGERKEYVVTKDIPLSIFYIATYILEKLRKIKRGL